MTASSRAADINSAPTKEPTMELAAITTALTEEMDTSNNVEEQALSRRDRTETTPTQIPDAAALRMERRFALAVAVIPLLGVVGAAAWRVMSLVDLSILIIMYTVTGLGITVGYHRLFTHASFKCAPWLKAGLAIAGSMALEGPVIRWVADHRRHHAFSDREGDPHSPKVGGKGGRGALALFFHAHMGWFFASEKTKIRRFVPDLLTDPLIKRIDRHYYEWIALSLALPFVAGGLCTMSLKGAFSALLWGGLVRIFLIHHVTWSINSVCHVFGRRPYDTRDSSTNNFWLAIPSFGESWHNNHHAFPTAAVHGMDGFQIDPSGLLLRGLEKLGMVSDLKMPTEAQRAKKRNETTGPHP